MFRKVGGGVWALLLLLPVSAPAQSTFGTILGTVTDESGAVVPAAKVTIRDIDENVVARSVATDAQGYYEAQNLKAGRYEVAVEAAGFRKFIQTAIPLLARQTIRIDVTLKVGQVVQAVTVEGRPALVTSESGTIAASLGSRGVLELPVIYRGAGTTSPYSLLAFLPGVQSDNAQNFSIQGALPYQSQYSVDGISTVNARSNGPLREMFPSAESIAEMRVQGVGNNAELGNVADITTTSKSGTNIFHGSAFEYHQNSALDATAFGSPTKPRKTSNDFGGSVGGPLRKNGTFFFGTYEAMRFPRTLTIINTVPTQAMRNGDFSKEPGTIINPANGQPFGSNQLPPGSISSIAGKILAFYPLPNFGSTDVEKGGNFRVNRTATQNQNQYDLRIDHVLTKKQSIFGRWTWKDFTAASANRLLIPTDNAFDNYKSLVVSHNYAIAPGLLNEFRFGITFRRVGDTLPLDTSKIIQDLAFQGLGDNRPPGLLPHLSFAGITSDFFHGKSNLTLSRNTQFTETFTWLKGRHTMKFGTDIRRLRSVDVLSFTTGDDYGDFDFEGTFTGNDIADFLLGLPDNATVARTGPDTDGNVTHYHFFGQDSFKVGPRLTLEYGLRYDLEPGFRDATDNITNFDRSVPVTGRVIIPSSQQAQSITAPGFLSSINACPAPPINGVPCTPFLTAKQAGWPENLRFTDHTGFRPRFGFAFRPFSDNRTVIRGSAGWYTADLLGSVFFSLTGIHSSNVTFFQNALRKGAPLFQWPQTGVGAGVSGGPVGSQDFRTANNPNFPLPYSIQWDLTVEREVGWGTALRVSYIGLRSVQLTWAPDLNQPRPSTTFFVDRPLTDRPFPNWNIVFSRDNGGNGIYNALQFQLTHRVRSGLTFDSAWTWAKNLSDSQGPTPGGFQAENGGGRAMNFYNRAADHGNVAASRRHRWVTTLIYDLPFGEGQRFANTANPWINELVGRWHISNIVLLQTGPFLTPSMTGGDPSGTAANNRSGQRPDRVGNGNISSPTADHWWDRKAFVCPGRQPGAANQFSCGVGLGKTPPIARFGNSGVGVLVGPGTINWSFGFGKDFKITERLALKFDGLFRNLPNHPNLNDPVTRVNASTFGQIFSARGADAGGSRVGEFALRLEW